MAVQTSSNLKAKQNKAQPKKGAAKDKQPTRSMEECIEICLECFRSCSSLIPHCLEMGGEHASKAHIGLLASCAAICETSAKFMLAESEFHTETCRVCADVCTACAEDCERLGADDEFMSACAEICRRCAKSCEQMAVQH